MDSNYVFIIEAIMNSEWGYLVSVIWGILTAIGEVISLFVDLPDLTELLKKY